MATITMDTSEYEAMKDVKRLLEQSLEKERGLQDQIKKLNDEKIKALEDAKMKIIKITKTQVTEHAFIRYDAEKFGRAMAEIFGWTAFKNVNTDFLKNGLDRLYYSLFQRVESRTLPVEEFTTCGLDEVKSEIRNELLKDFNEKITSHHNHSQLTYDLQ
jgi:hypothetical protein